MKKIGLAIVALILIFVIYYITAGSKQITKEMKQEVHKELIQLEDSGFKINEQNSSKNKQHIVVTFQDINKITTYFNNIGQHISSSDIEILKGMQMGVDIEYMPRAKDAVGIDIYPLKLPTSFYKDIREEDKIIVTKIEKMIKDKLFLTHIDIDKLLSHFDGYVKDIDKKLEDNENTIHIITKGIKFNGTIKDEKIEDISQKMDILSLEVTNELNISLSKITSTVTNNNENIAYSIKSFDITNKADNPFVLSIDNITGSSQDIPKNNLLDTISKIKIHSIKFNDNGKKTTLNNISMKTSLNNINKKALEKLQQIASDNNSSFEQFMPLLKEIIKDNISIDIPNISVAKITNNSGKSFDGFKLKALIKVDKQFDWKTLDNDPLSIINIIDAKVNIKASNELVNILSSDPQAMVMMMIIQPIDKNGSKHYNIEFKKGSLKINGKPLM